MPLTPKLRNALRDAKPLPRYMPGKRKSITRADMQAGKQLPRRFGPPRPRPGRPPDNIAKVLGGGRPIKSRSQGGRGFDVYGYGPNGPMNWNFPPRGSSTDSITPPGGWQERYPAPTRGTLANPFTDTIDGKPPTAAQTPKLLTPQAPAPQGPQLARPVSNAGTNGSNARYFVGPGSGLQRGTHPDGRQGWTDGVYWYDDNGLSFDRPDAYVAGLGPANESERYDPWSGRSPSVGGPASAPSPLTALLGTQRAQPSAGRDTLAGLLGGGETTPAFGGMDDLPRGYEQLPDELLALIRRLIGQRAMAPPPSGSVL